MSFVEAVSFGFDQENQMSAEHLPFDIEGK